MDLNVFGWMASQPQVKPIELKKIDDPAVANQKIKISAAQPKQKGTVGRKSRIPASVYAEMEKRLKTCSNAAQVAREFGVSNKWALQIKRRIESGKPLPEYVEPISDEKIAGLLSLVIDGATVKDASIAAGITPRQGLTLMYKYAPHGVRELRKQHAEKL